MKKLSILLFTLTGFNLLAQCGGNPLPQPDFNSTSECFNQITTFTDLSTVSNGNIVSWQWNFGDGISSSTNHNPSYLYTAPGNYNVQLIAVSDLGCMDSVTKTITVNPNPVVNFVANDTFGCQPLCTSFQNYSSIVSGTNMLWVWDYGDGSSVDSTFAIDHCFVNPSGVSVMSYTISLTVTSDSGCVTTLFKHNYISIDTCNNSMSVNNRIDLPETFVIYPNPMNSRTVIAFEREQKNSTIKITNALGQEIKIINFTGNKLFLEDTELKSGIYFIQVMDENEKITTKKIIMQ